MQDFPGITLLTGYLEIEDAQVRHCDVISHRLHAALQRLTTYALDGAWVLHASCTDYVGRVLDGQLRRHDNVTVIVTGDARDATQFKRYVLPALQRDEPVVQLTLVGGVVSQPATGVRTSIVGLALGESSPAA